MHEEPVYNASLPIYLQIMDIVKHRIASGQWAAGDKIPSVRDLALEFGVNPNTVQRALAELERQGLLYSERTSGRFITADVERIEQMRFQMAHQITRLFIDQMEGLGYGKERILEAIDQELSNEKAEGG